MGARRYEIYLQVFNSIHVSHKWTSEILIWTQEDKFHISKQPCTCIILFILLFCIFVYFIFGFFVLFCLFYNKVFDNFPKISISKVIRTFSENIRRLPKIIEDCIRKIQRCFDLILINFGSFSIETCQTRQQTWHHWYLHMWKISYL